MTYSIFGPTPLFATEVLLDSLVVVLVVVLVVPPTIIAGGLWAGYMKEIEIFDDDDDDYKEATQTCRSREDSVLSEQPRRSGRESTEAAIGIVIMVKIVKIVFMVKTMYGLDNFPPTPTIKPFLVPNTTTTREGAGRQQNVTCVWRVGLKPAREGWGTSQNGLLSTRT